MRTLAKILVLVIVSILHVVSQQEVNSESVSVNDGLSQNSVYAVFQDSRGFMWFGTADGLNKFDGYKFTIYQNDPTSDSSILGSSIRVITEDREGNLWIGSDKGLSCFDRRTEKFSNYQWSIPYARFKAAIAILDICIDQKGVLWLATAFGIREFDLVTKVSKVFRMFPAAKEQKVEQYDKLFLGADNTLLTINDSGIVGFSIDREKFFIPALVKQNGSSMRWLSRLSDHEILFVDKKWNVFVVDTKTKQILTHAHVENKKRKKEMMFSGACRDFQGNLYVGVYDQGLIVLNAGDNRVKQYSNIGIVRSLWCDNSGIVWIGTDGGGVRKLNLHGNEFSFFSHDPNNANSLSGNFVKSILEDSSGTIWVGTVPDGLNRFQRENSTWKHYFHSEDNHNTVSSNSIISLNEDIFHRIWIGTDGGIDVYDPSKKLFRHLQFPDTRINCIYSDKAGSMWIASPLGVARALYTKADVHFIRFQNVYGENVSILRDHEGRIWTGSLNGFVMAMDSTGTLLKEYENISGIDIVNINNYVRCICEEPENIFWFATESGLVRLDFLTQQKTVFTTKDGLPNNFLYGIVPDNKGNLWISSNGGISRFNIGRRTFHNYDASDGLQSSEFNTGAYFRSKAGEIFFGGVNGFNIFTTKSVQKNTHPPIVAVTDFMVLDRRINIMTNIRNNISLSIPYNENTISFEMAALDYTNPKKNLYAHKLEGFDSKWTYTGTRRYIRYTNLDPGDYVLRVKACNNDGVWNEEGVSLPLTIVPPIWMTKWFGVSVIVVLALSIAAIARFVELRKVRKRIERLEREKALERERSRISKDMHDEVGSNLTKIAILSELAKREKGKDRLSNLEKISSSSREIIDNISHIIWAVDPKNDTLENTLAYIREYVGETLELGNIHPVFHYPESIPGRDVLSEFRRNIFLTIKEAVNNTVKYSTAHTLSLMVSFSGDAMAVTLSDDGKGFNVDEVSRFGNGLVNMRKRIEDIGGTFSVTSVPTHGTIIRFSVPITTFV